MSLWYMAIFINDPASSSWLCLNTGGVVTACRWFWDPKGREAGEDVADPSRAAMLPTMLLCQVIHTYVTQLRSFRGKRSVRLDQAGFVPCCVSQSDHNCWFGRKKKNVGTGPRTRKLAGVADPSRAAKLLITQRRTQRAHYQPTPAFGVAIRQNKPAVRTVKRVRTGFYGRRTLTCFYGRAPPPRVLSSRSDTIARNVIAGCADDSTAFSLVRFSVPRQRPGCS
jgi:hypothetical protein